MYAYIINMDSATDRWNFARDSFAKTGIPFERMPGVNGRAMTLPIPEFNEAQWRRRHGKLPNMGQIGCYLSHIRAMQRFLATGHEYGIICEDDILVAENLKSILLQAIEHRSTWDILRLAGFHNAHPIAYSKLGNGYSLAVNQTRLCGTGAYMVNRKAANTLVDKLLPMSLPIDHALDREWIYGLRSSAVYPLPISQENHPFASQIPAQKNEKLPAIQRYWTVFPFRASNEVTRLFVRSTRWLSARSAVHSSKNGGQSTAKAA